MGLGLIEQKQIKDLPEDITGIKNTLIALQSALGSPGKVWNIPLSQWKPNSTLTQKIKIKETGNSLVLKEWVSVDGNNNVVKMRSAYLSVNVGVASDVKPSKNTDIKIGGNLAVGQFIIGHTASRELISFVTMPWEIPDNYISTMFNFYEGVLRYTYETCGTVQMKTYHEWIVS